MPAPVLLDATPLASAHGLRGIGAAVRGLLDGLAARPEEERPVLLVRRDQEAPAGFETRSVAWPRWRSYRVPDPWPAAVGERIVTRMAGGGILHATQPALVPAGDRVVATCYDLIPLTFPKLYLEGPGRRLQAAAYRRYVSRLGAARMVLAISQESADDAVRLAGVAPERVRVVPLAAPTPAEPEGEVPRDPYVLYAGGLEPHKNPWIALAALAAAPAGLRLVMCGPWSPRRTAWLRRRAAALGVPERLDALGFVTPGRLSALRRGALAVLVPSLKEGFGLPVLEGMAAGVPVLASDIPALREAGGDAARYLPPADAAAWGRAIGELAADPGARRAGAEAGAAQAARFTWERTAELTVLAWREVQGGA
jgi:glycosyltransferase involved in cell wall biosynthesis